MFQLYGHPAIQTDPDFDAFRKNLRERCNHIYTDLHLENDTHGNPHGHLHELWEETGHQVLLQARVFGKYDGLGTTMVLAIDDWQVFRTLVDRTQTAKAIPATRRYLNLPQGDH